jgi:hypothetical protein
MSDSYLEKGIAAAKQGNNPLAIENLKRALANDPQNVHAWLWLASVLDDPQKQIECLKRVLRIQPDHQMAKNAIKQLQKKIGASPVAEKNPIYKPGLPEQKMVRASAKGDSAKSSPTARPRPGFSSPQSLLIIGLLVFGFVGFLGVGTLAYVFRENLFSSLSSVTDGVGGKVPIISPDVPTPINATPVAVKDARATIKNNNFKSVELLGAFQRDAKIIGFSAAQLEKRIAISYEDNFTHVLDINKGVPIWAREWNATSWGLALDPSGSRLSVNDMIVDIKSNVMVPREAGFGLFSPKSDLLITNGFYSRDNAFQVWTTSNGNFSHSIKINSESVGAMAFAPDGSFFVYQDEQANVSFFRYTYW